MASVFRWSKLLSTFVFLPTMAIGEGFATNAQFSSEPSNFSLVYLRYQHKIPSSITDGSPSPEFCARFLAEVKIELLDPYARHLAFLLELLNWDQFHTDLPGFWGEVSSFDREALDPFFPDQYRIITGYRFSPKDSTREDYMAEIYCAEHNDESQEILIVSYIEGLDIVGGGVTGISYDGLKTIGHAAGIFNYLFELDEMFLTTDNCSVSRLSSHMNFDSRLDEIEDLVKDCKL